MATPRRLWAIAERRVSGLVAMRRAAAWTYAVRTGSSAGSFVPVAGARCRVEGVPEKTGPPRTQWRKPASSCVPSDPVDEVRASSANFPDKLAARAST